MKAVLIGSASEYYIVFPMRGQHFNLQARSLIHFFLSKKKLKQNDSGDFISVKQGNKPVTFFQKCIVQKRKKTLIYQTGRNVFQML